MVKYSKYQIVRHYKDGESVAPPSKYYYVELYSSDRFGKNVELLLPVELADELERIAKEEKSLNSVVAIEELVASPKPIEELKKTPDNKNAVDELRLRHVDEHFLEVEIFPEQEKQKLLDRSISSSDLNFRKRSKEIHAKLDRLGNVRAILRPFWRGKVNEPSMPSLLKKIESDFDILKRSNPQFKEIVDIYCQAVTVSLMENRIFSVPPILMVGLPGIGKSHFARELCNVLKLPLEIISFDTAVTNSEILGSSQYWGNTHYGRMFETICLGDIGNPVFLLEEIDKAGSYGENRSAINSLHVLLESSTSKNVTDVSVNIAFDASYVTWLATANTTKNILPSLLSRFNIIYISAPNGRDSLQIATELSKRLCAESGCGIPQRSIVSMLACFSPREQMKALRLAILSAKKQPTGHHRSVGFFEGVFGRVRRHP